MKRILLALGGTLSLILSAYCLLTAVFLGWLAVTPSFPMERLEEVHLKTNLSLVAVALFFLLGIASFFFLWRSHRKRSQSLDLK